MAVPSPTVTRGLGADLRAGAVVCLVALPLCLGIALASGAPLAAGLVTGIVGGLLVSALGGTQLLVSGPAAGLATIVLAAITELGSFEALLTATVMAGLIQGVLGLARLGRLARVVPSTVVTGMLAAIGVLLILQQIPHALGVKPPGGHGPERFLALIEVVGHAVPAAAVVAGVSLAVVVAMSLPTLAPLARVVPGPVVGVVAGTFAAELLAGGALGPVARVDLPEAGGWFLHPDLGALANPATWRIGVTLAIVASIESLLSLEATDQLDPLRRRSNADRELVAQGLGNTVAGLLGGLPMTGVIVRSSANIAAGGRTWVSAFFHAVFLAILVVAAPWLIERVPLPALAAILLFTGFQLAHPARLRAVASIGRGTAVILAITLVGIVLTDLLIGVALGFAASAVRAMIRSARHGIEIEQVDGAHVRVVLGPDISFVHKGRLATVLEQAPEGGRVTVDGRRSVVDHDVVELLHRFADTARERGVTLELVGVPALAGPSPSH